MSNIEHLFENIIATMDTGGDLLALKRHPITQHMLGGVNATFDEILSIALYVKHTYCQTCEKERPNNSRKDESL